MRKLLAPLALAAALAVGGATTATAAPSNLQITVGAKATLQPDQITLRVPVTVTCPFTFGLATTQVGVSQASTGRSGLGSRNDVQCTGAAVATTVDVQASLWALGQAIATGDLFAGSQRASVTRRIQIVAP